MRQLLLRHISLWFVFVLCAGPLVAQSVSGVLSDTLDIRFPLNQTDIDMDFDGNADRWRTFEQVFNRRYAGLPPAGIRLDIYAGASPEGPAELNRRLGERRGTAVRRLIRERLGQRVGGITVYNQGARWAELYDRVAMSHEPWRDDVLHILETAARADTPAWATDPRETLLRRLHGGTVWPTLLTRYLAPLRSGATAVLSWRPDCDTVYVRDTVIIVNNIPAQMPSGTSRVAVRPGSALPDSVLSDSLLSDTTDWHAEVGTNLLYLATSTLNAFVDVGISRHWSLMLALGYNPFTWPTRHTADDQLINPKTLHWLAESELRFWPGGHLRGWWVGLHGLYSHYNVGGLSFIPAMDHDRYEGYLYGGGVAVGYHWWLDRNRRWGMSASLGGGYVRLVYDRWENCNCGDLVGRYRRNYVGPTQAALRLTYRIR